MTIVARGPGTPAAGETPAQNQPQQTSTTESTGQQQQQSQPEPPPPQEVRLCFQCCME